VWLRGFAAWGRELLLRAAVAWAAPGHRAGVAAPSALEPAVARPVQRWLFYSLQEPTDHDRLLDSVERALRLLGIRPDPAAMLAQLDVAGARLARALPDAPTLRARVELAVTPLEVRAIVARLRPLAGAGPVRVRVRDDAAPHTLSVREVGHEVVTGRLDDAFEKIVVTARVVEVLA
jgi:hypothetical protein